MSSHLKVDYWFNIGDRRWVSIEKLTPERVLDYWLGRETLTCCSILGGFVFFDGESEKSWNGHSLDEVQMSWTWIGAMKRLLEGYNSARVWAWEQSEMTLVRRDDQIEMFDVQLGGFVSCLSVTFPFRKLLRSFANVAEDVADFVDELLKMARDKGNPEQLETLERNLCFPWKEEALYLRKASEMPIPPPPDNDPGPIPEIFIAIRLGDRERFDRALKKTGPNILYEENSPLHFALDMSRPWTFNKLLDAGADPNHVNMWEDSLLNHAYIHGQSELVEKLLKAGAELDLSSAVTTGNIEKTKQLAEQTPNFPDIFGILINRINWETRDGKTIVTDRIDSWRPACDALKAAGATPDSPGEQWNPALQEAIYSEKPELVKFALSLGAHPLHQHVGQTALELAESLNSKEIVELLRQALG